MPQSNAKNAIVLGLLSAVGPFATDMYLPALPVIARDFGTSAMGAQASVAAFFLAVAVGQIFYGPISDSFGRKPPLYFGMALYAIGAMGCSLAPTIEWLIVLRFVQGIGACAGMTIPRAVVRDLYTGPDAARLMALIMLVFSVSPILAPLLGSAVAEFTSWRLIFLTMALIGLLGLAVAVFVLKETRLPQDRVAIDFGSVASGYLMLLQDRHFLGVSCVGGFGMASFFAFLAGSSFVYIDHFGFTPAQYSLAFSINAVAFIGAAQLTGWIGRRVGLKVMVSAALTYYVAVTLGLFGVTLAGVDNAILMMACLFCAFGGLGLVIPSVVVLALENYAARAGAASALLGTLQLVTGAVVVSVVGAISDQKPLPMLAAIALCAVAAFIIGRLTLSGRSPVTAAAE